MISHSFLFKSNACDEVFYLEFSSCLSLDITMEQGCGLCALLGGGETPVSIYGTN